MEKIALIHTDFPEKFGVPKQSGLINELSARIVFTEKYRNPDAVRGLECFSHIWLLWEFSKNDRHEFSPTVRPPRLGGNTRMGVFATRSPFRPNPIGLSSVILEKIDFKCADAPVLYVRGADLVDGTPIIDIKPYIKYTDCHTDAVSGFAAVAYEKKLNVIIPPELLPKAAHGKLASLIRILENDPTPAYQDDPQRIYGLSFAGMNVKFKSDGTTLRVTEITTE